MSSWPIHHGKGSGRRQTLLPLSRTARVYVWDSPTRLFHWSLVGLVLIAWITAGTGEPIHEISGYGVAALVAFRIVWGVVGTRFALFRDFVTTPFQLLRYLWALLTGKAKRYLGHNPAGGAMIIILLILLIIISATGIMQMTRQFFGLQWVEDVHIWATNGLLLTVPLHIAGVIVSSWLHRENLVSAMISGTKSVSDHDAPGAAPPTAREQLLSRIHASQGFSLLLIALAGALYYGVTVTGGRVVTIVTADKLARNGDVSTARLTVPAETVPRSPPIGGTIQTVDEKPVARNSADGSQVSNGVSETARQKVITIQMPLPFRRPSLRTDQTQLAILRVSLPLDARTGIAANAVAGRAVPESEAKRIARGGQLYDDWQKVLAVATPATRYTSVVTPSALLNDERKFSANPDVYFSSRKNRQDREKQLQRCSSCHGWAYDGVKTTEGAAARTPGGPTLRHLRGRDPNNVIAVFSNATHRVLSNSIPGSNRILLALFLTKGQHNIARYIAANGAARGNAKAGAKIYQRACLSCHGDGGEALSIQTPPASVDIGTTALMQPAYTLHLLRNGHPGYAVPTLRTSSISSTVDLLAYLQTLPGE